jgi:hypothetical protein
MAHRGATSKLCRLCLVLVLAAAMSRAPAASEDSESLHERHATILVKALSYDEKLIERAGTEVVVAVLYRASSRSASDDAEVWRRAFAGLSSLRFLGLPFRTLKLPLASPEQMRKTVAQEGIDAFFVLDMTKDDLALIQKVARENKVVTLASREDQVAAGLSLGVFVIDDKNTLIVNLSASRAEGAVFGAALLKLAKVIK